MRFFQKYKKPLEGNCYNIKTLSLDKWDELIDNNNISVLIEEGQVSYSTLEAAYYGIMDAYRNLIGTPVEFLDKVKAKIKLEIAHQMLIITGKKEYLNTINMLTIDIEDSEVKTITKAEERAAIAKFIGFPINPKNETLESYCGYVLNYRKNGSN